MKIVVLFLLVVSLNAQYILTTGYRPKTKVDRIKKHSFLDMKIYPQNLNYYAKQVVAMPRSRQLKYDNNYNYRYFLPWSLNYIDAVKHDIGWESRMVSNRPIYYANGSRVSQKTIQSWLNNANMDSLNTKGIKAITIKHTSLHAMPTYSSFYLAKRGKYIFDFNYNQNTAIYPNTPLLISHFSKDKRWAYVLAPFSTGWVNTNSIAIANKNFIKAFKSGSYAVAIKDNLRLLKNNHSYTLVKLGTIFPIEKKSYLIATKSKDGFAKLEPIIIKNSNTIAKKPLAFNAANVAKVAKEFVGEPYGWGGGFYCRDCSATTRDFFGVFGIFLSRNSAKQAKEGYRVRIPKGSYNFRKNFILTHAKPFRSLMYVPGHIVIYLGQYKGEPIIMHTYWGVRKKDFSKIITARTIITSLEAGKERSDTRVRSRMIYTLKDIISF